MTNCPNCGAPIRRTVCEYCGTPFVDHKSQTANTDEYINRIRFVSDMCRLLKNGVEIPYAPQEIYRIYKETGGNGLANTRRL